jgi:hypothetical protein
VGGEKLGNDYNEMEGEKLENDYTGN